MLSVIMYAVDTIGPRIRSAREAAGLTQDELADAIGVSATSIKNWESGRVKTPPVGKLEKVLGIVLRDQGSSAPRLDDASVHRLIAELAARFATLEQENERLRRQYHGATPSAIAAESASVTALPLTRSGMRRAARTRDPEDRNPEGPEGSS